MLTTFITAAAAFIATNIDDIFLLMIYFSQVGSTLSKRHIVLGQALGFGAIVIVSAVGFLGGLVIPQAWIGMLGLFPIYLGLRRFFAHADAQSETDSISEAVGQKSPLARLFAPQTASIAVVTFANGGDNISVYIPLFAGQSLAGLGIIAAVFTVLLGLWCWLGYLLGSQPFIASVIRRYSDVIVPFVLIGLGVYILLEAGTLAMFLGAG